MVTRIVAFGVSLALVASPGLAQQLHAELVASGLTQPVDFVQDPTQSNVQFIVQQGGLVLVLQNGVVLSQPFLDLSADVSASPVGGLFGLAFTPDSAVSGRFFVNFTDQSGNTVIARFVRSLDNPLVADPASRFDLVWPSGDPFIVQPYGDHNGGDLAFGPDGFLYIALGDGGGVGDPDNRAQNPTTLLGKVLRIDVSVGDSDPTGYSVPVDNPFIGQDGVLPEIWAFGLRNPWRYSFDDPASGGTGALVIADVGESSWEEIDYEPAGQGGRNYGWRNREGAHDFDTSAPPFSPLTDPTFEYSHAVGHSITGGSVYRGSALDASFLGRYFFADFIKKRVWSLGLIIDPTTGEASAGDLIEHTTELGGPSVVGNVVSFGVDANGELYIVGYSSGEIHRIAAGPGSPPPSGPPTCSGTDPFTSLGGGTCVDGGWLPPGSTPPGGGSGSGGGSSGGGSTGGGSGSGGCTTPDPFADLGGGTCVDGGWLPPSSPPPGGGSGGGSGSGGSGGGGSTGGGSACTTPDPFATLGGGTCVDGGWLPPGTPPPGGGSGSGGSGGGSGGSGGGSSPPACSPPDPFADLGGGTCVNGGWLPPGTPPPGGGSGSGGSGGGSTGGGGGSGSSSGCTTPDPFASLAGLVGVCTDGGWTPVSGVKISGTVRHVSVPGGAPPEWVIVGDDGQTYELSDVLPPAFQVDGLRVAFAAIFRTDLTGTLGPVVQLITISPI
jgi:glucose/arabinose dehydrogenase